MHKSAAAPHGSAIERDRACAWVRDLPEVEFQAVFQLLQLLTKRARGRLRQLQAVRPRAIKIVRSLCFLVPF